VTVRFTQVARRAFRGPGKFRLRLLLTAVDAAGNATRKRYSMVAR